MKNIIMVWCCGVALFMAGCSTLKVATTPVGQIVSVDLQKTAYEAKLVFEGSLIVVNAYIQRPRCGNPGSPVTCSDQSVVTTMRKAIIATDAAVQAAENAVRSTGPDTTVATALVDVATQSASAFETISKTVK